MSKMLTPLVLRNLLATIIPRIKDVCQISTYFIKIYKKKNLTINCTYKGHQFFFINYVKNTLNADCWIIAYRIHLWQTQECRIYILPFTHLNIASGQGDHTLTKWNGLWQHSLPTYLLINETLEKQRIIIVIFKLMKIYFVMNLKKMLKNLFSM